MGRLAGRDEARQSWSRFQVRCRAGCGGGRPRRKVLRPFSRRALRVSMGGVLQTPVYQARNLREEIKLVRERWNVPFFATTLDEVAISSYDHGVSVLAQRQYVAFVFGNEYSGLTAETIALCDQSVKIPMHGDVDSLNLGVSVGIFLYEFNRWNAR